MLVIARSLVLTAEETEAEDNPLILWRSVVTTTNVTSTTADPAHPVTNVANPATHLFWRGLTSTSDEYVTVVTGATDPIDGVGIARHNFGSKFIPASIEVCSDLGASPQVWVEAAQAVMPADDSPLLYRFTPATYQGVRVHMYQGAGVPEIGALYVQKLLVLERSIKIDTDHTPINQGRIATVYSGRSASGNFLGRRVTGETRAGGAEFEWFNPGFYRDNIDPFIVASQEAPFFFAWNPSEYPLDVGYCWMTQDPLPKVDPVTRRVALSLKFQGIA